MSSLESLQDLLLEQLRDLYSAEKQLVKALPKLARAASNSQLQDAFTGHLAETEGHLTRLEQAFARLGCPPRTKTCQAMQGLVAEGHEAVALKAPPAVRDAALIAAAQRVEHYEIAAYGTARAFAQELGADGIAQLLNETLHEEADADKVLTALSHPINSEAALGHEVPTGR